MCWKGVGGLGFWQDPATCLWAVAHCTIEANLRLPYLTLSTVEDNDMLMGCLHELARGVSHAPKGYGQ